MKPRSVTPRSAAASTYRSMYGNAASVRVRAGPVLIEMDVVVAHSGRRPRDSGAQRFQQDVQWPQSHRRLQQVEMFPADRAVSFEVIGHGIDRRTQGGEELDLIEFHRPVGGPPGVGEPISGEMGEASLGCCERLALALSVHERSA